MTWKFNLFNTPNDVVVFLNANGITLAQTLPVFNKDGQYVLFWYN